MIDFNTRGVRLIGFYNKPNQTMRDEEDDVESASELTRLLKISFTSLSQNDQLDALFKSILKGNTVFILKDRKGNLFAYYPWKNKSRVTDVVYDKKDVTPIPLAYKRWFIPGEPIILIKEKAQRKVGITTRGSDFLVTTKDKSLMPLEWGKKRISVSDITELIANPFIVLQEFDTDEACEDCDRYDYSGCDMSRCREDCDGCGGRIYICNDQRCFYHRYREAYRACIDVDKVSTKLSPLKEALELANKPKNQQYQESYIKVEQEFSELMSKIRLLADECRYYHICGVEELDSFLEELDSLRKYNSDLNEGREQQNLLHIYIDSKLAYSVPYSDVKCDYNGILLWRTYYISAKTNTIYDKISDSILPLYFKVDFSSMDFGDSFIQNLNKKIIRNVYFKKQSNSEHLICDKCDHILK